MVGLEEDDLGLDWGGVNSSATSFLPAILEFDTVERGRSKDSLFWIRKVISLPDQVNAGCEKYQWGHL